MPQDAFHIRRLANELNGLLSQGKINRISQVSKDELTFIIYTGKSTVKLIISTNATTARVCISSTEKEPLAVAPNFCMLLRKHLQNAEILSVSQHEEERIIKIEVYCTSDFSSTKRELIIELMGKYSNVVLCENGVILGALKTSALLGENARPLFAGAKYTYPAPQDKINPLDGAGMRSLFENYLALHENPDTESVAKCLFENVAGFALPTAREIVKRADKPLWEFIPAFFANEKIDAHVTSSDFFAFPVFGGEKTPSLCKAEDTFFSKKEGKKSFDDKRKKLESAIGGYRKKSGKRLQDICERLALSEKAEENRIKGELLTANLYRLEKGARFIELENWYDEQGGTIKISLDERLSPAQNAQKYFKAYTKQKRAKEILLPMKEKEEAEIEYANTVLSAIRLADTEEDFKEIETELISLGVVRAPVKRIGAKKKETEIPFREFTFDGTLILAGRNNIQNDRLLKLASGDDIWLHTQKYHSSHVIIRAQGEQVSDELIKFGAEICAYFSDGREGDKIPVDYCKRKYVKKPSKSKAGFVTYTNYKTILVTPKKHPQKTEV